MPRASASFNFSLTVALFLLTSASLSAQNLAWTARDGGILTDSYTELGAGPGRGVQSQSMAMDTLGNVYVIGTLYGGGVQGFDIVVMKFDAGGARRWTATYDSGYGDQAYSLALDGNGDVTVLGRQSSLSWFVAKFDGGDGSRQWIRTIGPGFQRFNALAADSLGNTYVAGAASGFRVLKLDAAGVQQWSVTSGGGTAQVIEVDSAGNVYAAGSGFKTVKYDSAGVQQWASVYGGAGALDVYDLDLDGAGNLYLTGYRQLSGNQDILTLKLGGGGGQQWEAVYDGGSWDIGFSLAVDGGGNVYVTGQSDTPTQGDFLTLKYNSSGAPLWSATYDNGGGFDISYDIAVDSGGNVTVTGRAQAGTAGGFHTIQYDPSGAKRWEATYDGPGEDQAQAVLVDPLGNVYVAGTSFDVNADLRVVKYDGGGTELWSAREGATDNAADFFGSRSGFFSNRKTLALDPAGSAWMAGSSFNGRNWDVRLAKLDSAGVRQWVSVLDTGYDDEPVALTVDSGGNVYVTAFSLPQGSTNYDFQTAKYDPSGTLLWRAAYDGGGLDLPGDIAVDASGNVLVIGRTLNGPNPYDFLTVKYDAAGALLWSTTYDGGRTDLGTEVEIDAAGNVIVSGSSQGSDLEWDTSTLKYDAAGTLQWTVRDIHFSVNHMAQTAGGNLYLLGGQREDVSIVKYDSSGAQEWRSSYDGGGQDIPLWIAADAAGNTYATGFTYNGSDYDFLTLSWDASGARRWVANYDNGDFELGQSLALDGGGNVYVAGYSWNGVDDDVRLVKYDAAGTQQWAVAYDNGSNDYGYGVALDALGGVYVAGDSVGSTTGSDLLLLKYVEQTRTVAFTATASSLSEKANSVVLSVVLTTSDGLPSLGAVTVGYSTADGTAQAGQDYTAASGTLSFAAGTPSGIALTVTIPLLDDFVVEGDESFTAQLGSPTGALLTTAAHTVTLREDDKAGADVRPRSGLRTDEDGGSDTFTIALTSQPTADVILALSSGDTTEGTVFPESLRFTPADWNLPRTITVTGVDDLEVDGNISYTIVLHPATSADAAYQGLDAPDPTARNQDNDRGRRP
ncbi:MAG TPA: Calx-beta domain-containing protein [Thermoanaerobaculia bacterium]